MLRGKFHRNQFLTDRDDIRNLGGDCLVLFGSVSFFVASNEMTGLRASKVEFSSEISQNQLTLT